MHVGILASLVPLSSVPEVAVSPAAPRNRITAIRRRPLMLTRIAADGHNSHAVLATGVRYEVRKFNQRQITDAEVYWIDPYRSLTSGWYPIRDQRLKAELRGLAALRYQGGTSHDAVHTVRPTR